MGLPTARGQEKTGHGSATVGFTLEVSSFSCSMHPIIVLIRAEELENSYLLVGIDREIRKMNVLDFVFSSPKMV